MHYPRFHGHLLPALGALALMGNLALGQISYVSGTYTQNFDTLATAATVTANAFPFEDNVTIPGWYASSLITTFNGAADTFTLTGTVTDRADAYSISNGSTNAGDLFSLGAFSAADRALGVVGSSQNDYYIAVRFTNNTGLPLKSFTVTYDGEQWRRGGTATERPESMHVFYRVGGDAVDSTGTWVNVPQLIFTSPIILPSVGLPSALDGNLPENRVAGITRTVRANIPAGETIWILFADADDGGNDHAMGIDNFSFSAEVNTGEPVTVGAGSTFTANSFAGAAFSADDTAVFSGTAKTVTLSSSAGPVAAAELSFANSGFVLAGSASDALTLEGGITVDADATATISGVLAGTSGITKFGTGTLLLSGSNTVSGPISVSAGRLEVSSDSALGDAANDLSVTGVFAPSGANFTLGAGRTLSGGGTVETAIGGTLTIAGPLDGAGLTFSGPSTLNLSGSSKSIATLVLPQSTAVNISNGALSVTSGVTLGQTSGTTTFTGDIGFNAGSKPFSIAGGTATINGTMTLGGGRVQKYGPGTLDLATSTTVAAAGGWQVGSVGTTSIEGGTLSINEANDLGTLQMFFNSGTLLATSPIVSSIGISIGGRADGTFEGPVFPVALPTFSGANITFNTGSSYFFYGAAGSFDRVAFKVDNVTRFEGVFAKTGSSATSPAASPVWIRIGGSGNAVFAGDASVLVDDFDLDDTVTLTIDGQLGGRQMFVDTGTTLAGSGIYRGQASADVQPNVSIFGTLNPTGTLTINAGLALSGVTELDIAGPTPGSGFDQVALTNTAATATYALAYGGALELDFTTPAQSGVYDLFPVGAGVTRSSLFASVVTKGAHTATLNPSGSVWSGSAGATSFSFDESTGVLTVTGGAPANTPLEDWRQANFGGTANSGNAADSADFDGDGVSNLIEYATGTNPTVANASPVVLGKNGTGEFLTLSFNRIADPSLTYEVISGGDLAAGLTTVAQTYGGTAADTVLYTDTVSLATPGVRRFLALRVRYGDL